MTMKTPRQPIFIGFDHPYQSLLQISISHFLNMAIEIVDLPMKNGDFPELRKRLPEGQTP